MHIHVHVRVCTYPAFLHQICEHDDTAGVHLPDHPPEVIGGVWEGALGSDVCTLPLVTLYTHVSKKLKIFYCWDFGMHVWGKVLNGSPRSSDRSWGMFVTRYATRCKLDHWLQYYMKILWCFAASMSVWHTSTSRMRLFILAENIIISILPVLVNKNHYVLKQKLQQSCSMLYAIYSVIERKL